MPEWIPLNEFLDTAGDWRLLSDGANAFFRTRSLAESARFVEAVSRLDAVDDHPPDIDIRPEGVTVRTSTFDEEAGGTSRRDLDLAVRISEVARELGLRAEPSTLQSLLIVPGAPSVAEVMPFWQAALGYEPRADSPDEDLVDPHRRGAPLWFERMDEPRADGGGAVHVAVWLPPEAAAERLDAALAAGGRMVRDEFAPSWWTLADAAGNEIDISSVDGRI